MRLRRRKGHQEVVELNITAFMNLMVILVPFLLITAVFSRMTVLELNLPSLSTSQEAAESEKELVFQLTVRDRQFVMEEESIGKIFTIERSKTENDYFLLQQYLMQIKEKYPEEKDIMLMLEPGITYDTIIAVMDRVKTVDQVIVNEVVKYELFPDVSISDALPIQGDDL
jgi:biopolymer transport protein ExbD